MGTFSALLALCAGNSPVTGEFSAQRPVTRSFDIFFDLRLNKRLSKQSRGWWFETPSRPIRHQCNVPTCKSSYENDHRWFRVFFYHARLWTNADVSNQEIILHLSSPISCSFWLRSVTSIIKLNNNPLTNYVCDMKVHICMIGMIIYHNTTDGSRAKLWISVAV